MTDQTNKTSLRSAALISGLAILTMAIAAPFAELYVYPKLVIAGNAAETVKNIMANETLFRAAIFAYLITFIADVVASWALYVLFKPVNEHLSLLTSWFRLVYTVIAIVALLDLLTVLRLLGPSDYLKVFEPDHLYAQVMLSLNAFKKSFHFGIVFFGIHLGLLGFLIFRSKYIPKTIGVLVIISGLGYFITSLKPFFPDINIDFAKYTFYGELIFMFWLLIRGSKIQEPNY
ncbi:DUF4386 domain-containing protein [bacterium]|nr:DUF4386 domain-containing protein [bacterium]